MSRLRGFVVAGTLLLAACAGGEVPTTAQPPAGTEPTTPSQEQEATAPATEPGQAAAPTTEPGQAAAPTTPAGEPGTPGALAFDAPLVGGGTFSGGDYDGRDVALWFWAPW